MLYINPEKVDNLVKEHRAYLQSVLLKRFTDKNAEIEEFKVFFAEYCGSEDIDSIQSKLVEVCLSPNLKNVIDEFDIAFKKACRVDFVHQKYSEPNSETQKMSKLLDSLLKYEDFNKGTKKWNRHIYLTKLDVRVCPYCNRNYITSYIEDDYKHTTADVDHYYPKSLYPILQMNLYNMIPSCSICNSRMKNDDDKRHLYPFRDSNQSLLFRTENKTIGQLYNYSADDITIDILPQIDKEGRSQGSIDVFKLKQVYGSHKNIVHELIERIYDYEEMSENYYTVLLGKELSNKIWDEEKLRNNWFDFLHKEALNEPLVKMKQDIYRQFSADEHGEVY